MICCLTVYANVIFHVLISFSVQISNVLDWQTLGKKLSKCLNEPVNSLSQGNNADHQGPTACQLLHLQFLQKQLVTSCFAKASKNFKTSSLLFAFLVEEGI